jgi:hypothetical protein
MNLDISAWTTVRLFDTCASELVFRIKKVDPPIIMVDMAIAIIISTSVKPRVLLCLFPGIFIDKVGIFKKIEYHYMSLVSIPYEAIR